MVQFVTLEVTSTFQAKKVKSEKRESLNFHYSIVPLARGLAILFNNPLTNQGKRFSHTGIIN